MSSLLELSSALSPDTRLYRTMDFFGAAAMHTGRQLMFTRADKFEDRNEGIDLLLTQLELTHPNSGCGMGWTDATSAREQHALVKHSHYISCWSRNAESVAMWSLYSPDFCSVRVSTTVAKLLVPVESLLTKYSLGRLTGDDVGNRVVIATGARIEPVTYASLSDIMFRVNRRAKARIRLHGRYERTGRKMPTPQEINPRYWEREQQRRLSELRTTCTLKDASFAHEAEVRLTVRLGEEPCHQIVLDRELPLLDPAHEYHTLLASDLKAWGWVKTSSIPEREFAPCAASLIDSVAIDPRCPPHKAAFMRRWFEEHGIAVGNSTCFGYLPDSFSVFPYR